MRKIQKGFTLIELAVVIAVLAILVAFAMPRFVDTAAQAELSNIKDLKSQLANAAAVYTAEQSIAPAGFNAYVSSTAAGTAVSPLTINVGRFGPNAAKGTPCSAPTATTLTCSPAFNKWDVVYNFNNGIVTVGAVAKNGNTAAPVKF